MTDLELTPLCSKSWWFPGTTYCHNRASVVRDGKPYCKKHDPVANVADALAEASDDLKLTCLCAEATGGKIVDVNWGSNQWQDGKPIYPIDRLIYARGDNFTLTTAVIMGGLRFDPLHDDAQAMALVKKYPIDCVEALWDAIKNHNILRSIDFNRAICERVAKMQEAKR